MSGVDVFADFSRMMNFAVRETMPSEADAMWIKDTYRSIGQERIMALVTERKMLPFAAKLFVSLELATDIWAPVFDGYRSRNKRVIDELAAVYEQMEINGVKKAFLSENFGAMLSAGGDVGLFSSGDVDNYADISERERIDSAFGQLGYKKKDRFTGNLLISTDYSNDCRLPDGFDISIEYFPLSRLTLPCFISADDFVDWSQLKFYSDTRIALPPPAALMYICLLHISLHSFCRAPAIRLYRDIVNANAFMSTDAWKQIKAWSECDGVEKRIYTALYIANKIGNISTTKSGIDFSTVRNRELLSMVFDEKLCVLKKEPSRLKVLQIEALCNDKGLMSGIKEIVCPEKSWVQAVYGNAGALAYLSHLKRIL